MEKMILVCPKCGGTDILPHEKLKHRITNVFMATTTDHICAKCGYEGKFFLEMNLKDAEKLKDSKIQEDKTQSLRLRSSKRNLINQ